MSATLPSTCAPQRRPACSRSRSRGGASTSASGSSAKSRTRSWSPRRSCLPSSDPAKRAAELRETLHRALIAYYVDDEPVMTDAAYDALYDELVALEGKHPELVTSDSPTQRVGAPPSSKFEKVRHLQAMGSLDKVTTDEALLKWDADVRKRLGTDDPVAYVIEPKIDGLAINLTYEDAALIRGATRGDGVEGEE